MLDIEREEKEEGGAGIFRDREGVKDRRKARRETKVIFGGYFSPSVKVQESTLRCTVAFLSQSFLMHSI